MRIRPATLKEANAEIEKLHRHHKPVQGHRFSLLLEDDSGNVVGACCVGRPVSRELDNTKVAEVTRLVTTGIKNGCSMLYSASARACCAMGFETIQTYILDSEPGTSLRASGWHFSHMTTGGDWNHSKKYQGKRRTDQPMCPKQCWKKDLSK